ncbi:MAG: hypothetical protein QW267_04540 [Sulfolobales archaeon]
MLKKISNLETRLIPPLHDPICRKLKEIMRNNWDRDVVRLRRRLQWYIHLCGGYLGTSLRYQG